MPQFNLAIDAIVPPGPATPNAAYLLYPSTVPPPAYTPALVDSVTDSGGVQSLYSIITYNGKLFRFLIDTAVATGSINMWVSSDYGVTWVMVAGPVITHGTSPVAGFFSIYWDGVSPTATICYPADGVSGSIQFSDFNLSTQTFGAVYGTGGPVATSCVNLMKRSDGSLAAAYLTTYKGYVRLFAASFNGVWSTPVELSGPIPLTANVGLPQFIFDPNAQVLHSFIPTTAAAPAFVQQASGFSSSASTAVTIAAVAEGHTVIVFASSQNSTRVTGIVCTNITFTRQVFGNFAEVWIGVVSGGASGTTVTVSFTAVNANLVQVAEFSGAVQVDGTGSLAEGAKTVTTFYTNDTWTAPTGVTFVQIEAWGAGGNGATELNVSSFGGGGGGGGGYGIGTVAVVPGQTYNVLVAPQHTTGPSSTSSYCDASLAIYGQTGGDGGANGTGGLSGIGSTSNGGNGLNNVGASGGNGGNGANSGGAGGTGAPGPGLSRGNDGNAPGGGGGGGPYPPSHVIVQPSPGGYGAQGLVRLTYTPNPQTAPYTSTGYDLLLACIGILVDAPPTVQPTGYTQLTTLESPTVSLQGNYQITPNNVPGGTQSAAWTYATLGSWTALLIGIRAISNTNWYVPFLPSNTLGSSSQFSNPLGTNTVPSFAFGLGNVNMASGNTYLSIPVQTIDPVSLSKIPGLYRANVNPATPWVLDTTIDPAASADGSNILPGQIVTIAGTDYFFWLASASGVSTGATIIRQSTNQNGGGGWSARTSLFNAVTDDPLGLGSVAAQLLHNFSAVLYVSPVPPTPPPQVPAPAPAVSVGIPVKANIPLLIHYQILSQLDLLPNDADFCLLRDWRMFNRIQWPQLAFYTHGRPVFNPWGEDGIPHGAVTFNPNKSILLPDPVAGDTTVFSIVVPVDYDGVILGNYHKYTGAGVFVEGSGDIAWRVRVNGRYLRDMGNMLTTQGGPKTPSPVAGGVFVPSHGLIEYVVTAPNVSGFLPPAGQGRILTGLHGYFLPRTK